MEKSTSALRTGEYLTAAALIGSKAASEACKSRHCSKYGFPHGLGVVASTCKRSRNPAY
jgi:hypothetical protein